MPPPTDWQLLQLHRTGDRAAIETLIHRHIHLVYATACRLVSHRSRRHHPNRLPHPHPKSQNSSPTRIPRPLAPSRYPTLRLQPPQARRPPPPPHKGSRHALPRRLPAGSAPAAAPSGFPASRPCPAFRLKEFPPPSSSSITVPAAIHRIHRPTPRHHPRSRQKTRHPRPRKTPPLFRTPPPKLPRRLRPGHRPARRRHPRPRSRRHHPLQSTLSIAHGTPQPPISPPSPKPPPFPSPPPQKSPPPPPSPHLC